MILFCSASPVRAADDSLFLSIDKVLEYALAANPDIQEAKFAWISKSFGTAAQYGEFEPKLSGRAFRERAERPSALFVETKDEYKLGIQGKLPIGTSYDVGFNQATYTHSEFNSELYLGAELKQSLLKDGPLYGGSTNLLRQAKYEQQKLYQDYRQTLTDILEKICDAYWSYFYASQVMAFSFEAVKVTAEIYNDAKHRVKEGLISPLEFARAKNEWMLRQSALLDAQNSLRIEKMQLLLMIPVPEVLKDSLIILTDPQTDSIKMTNFDTITTNDTICQFHPLYLSQSSVVAYHKTVLDLHKNQRLPSLNIVGSYGFRSRDDKARAAIDKFKKPELRQKVLAGGVELELPLWANQHHRSMAKASEANLRSATIRLDLIAQQLLKEYLVISAQYHEVFTQWEIGKATVDFYQIELQDELTKIRLGKSSYHDIFEIEDNLRESKKREIKLARMAQIIKIQLQKATGSLLLNYGYEQQDSGGLILHQSLIN